MGEKNSIDLDSDLCSIIGSRLLDAPRELVFSAFTDPRHQNRITYEEIIPPERIVYRHGGGTDVEPVQFTQTLTFEALGRDRRRLTWHGRFPSAEERARVIKIYNADKGLSQTMARLVDYVATMASEKTT